MHRNNGHYITIETHLEGTKVKDLDRYLRMHQSILRHLIITALPQSIKTTNESELTESLNKRVEEKITQKEEAKIDEQKSNAVLPSDVVDKTPSEVVEEEKPKTKKKRVIKTNEEEKKEENAQERRKLVEEKLSEILKS